MKSTPTQKPIGSADAIIINIHNITMHPFVVVPRKTLWINAGPE
jgi:hypothetical protein